MIDLSHFDVVLQNLLFMVIEICGTLICLALVICRTLREIRDVWCFFKKGKST